MLPVLFEGLDEDTKQEIADATDETPYDGLCFCYAQSSQVWAFWAGEDLVAMGGLTPMPSKGAGVWLFCTGSSAKVARPLIRTLRALLQHQLKRFVFISGFAPTDLTKRCRWISALGFTFIPEIARIPGSNRVFQRFILSRTPCPSE